jgi:hypothetical protein
MRTFKKPAVFLVLLVAYALSIFLAKQKDKPDSPRAQNSTSQKNLRLPASE